MDGTGRRSDRSTSALAAIVLVVPLALGAAAGGDRLSPASLDCTAGSPSCPELAVRGDAPPGLPGRRPSPFRGFADPSVRRDPVTGRLWMSYSWPHLEVVGAGRPRLAHQSSAVVDIHLARSDDGGRSWVFARSLWTAERETDAGRSRKAGFSSHEVSTLAPRKTEQGVTWYAARLRYFVPVGGRVKGRRPDSFHLRVAEARSPLELTGAAESRLAGALTARGWRADVDLSALSPETAGCHIWNEPALHVEGDRLFLVAGCMTFDERTTEPLPERDFLAVFATEPRGDVRSWSWRYVGRLAGHREAAALAPGAESLVQTDLVRGRDGALLALLTPNRWDTALKADVHFGCRAVELVSLDPPAPRKTEDGAPVVRARIVASDLTKYGPAACGYDPASETGVLFVRRVWDDVKPEMVWTIHRTGIHP